MTSTIDADQFPEWAPFADAVKARRPETGTWCEAWTVRDIVAHQAGNAEELARVLRAHLEGNPVSTRSFEERKPPFRAAFRRRIVVGVHRPDGRTGRCRRGR
jgi:hypothetical protein